ncbi:MAG: multidrug transporter [Planctomycetes bacterium RBG_16_64_12]|nr:MAG: multidrug transporter [Planctomycetes bacterium RBG_16_64_12]
MKSLLRWAIRNTPAMNTLVVSVVLVGAVSLILTHRELFPEFELEIVLVTVPYPGASPEEVEEGICQKIEEAVRAIDGIKKQYAMAREGSGMVVLELEANVPDAQKVLNEIRSEVDRIPSFPELAEDPEVKQITIRQAAIRVGVIGPDTNNPDAEVKLREVTEQVRDQLLHLRNVSQANVIGGRDYQIDIEISESTLRKYGLTLQDVARIVRRQNVELPGGTMKTDSQEVLLRGKNRRLVGGQIAEIPLVTRSDGVVLTVGDLGAVRDEFVDTTAISRVNGRPGLVISVDKTANEDLLAIVDNVKQFIASAKEPGGYELPEGYRLDYWADMSVMVEDRLNLLAKNGLQGLILVLLILAVFLELRMAFWVASGIPVSMLGACWVLYWGGQTLNMLSMFAFLMALGILVDDAIVIGENIFAHREMGKSLLQAAVDGAYEALPSVVASVTTTIVAFVPLLFVPGVIGKFIAVMPLAVITMLTFSLLESTFILPCHLVHKERRSGARKGIFARVYRRWSQLPLPLTSALLVLSLLAFLGHLLHPQPFPWTVETSKQAVVACLAYGVLVPAALVVMAHLVYPLRRVTDLFAWSNVASTRLLDGFITRVYVPAVRWSLKNPWIVLSAAAAVLLAAAGWLWNMPFNSFPKLDSPSAEATIVYPDGTPASVTDEATKRLEAAIKQVDAELSQPGKSFVTVIHRAVGGVSVSEAIGPQISPSGSHVGNVGVELVETDKRNVKSTDIVAAWRREAGEFPGAESVTFGGAQHGPGGAPIEFKLLADPARMKAMEKAVEECKTKLKEYDGVFDIADDSRPGKWEFQLKIKDRAKAMGISLADLAETVRASYYGEEVMRLQRGRHEVKLMVRYPPEERRSLADFDEIRVRTAPPIVDLVRREVLRSSAAGYALGGGSSRLANTSASPERPLTELAEVEVRRGYSTINRQDQLRSITVTADVDEAQGNARKIVADLKRKFLPALLAKPEYAGIQVRWEGQQEQTAESIAGLMQGLAVALVAMFVILTLQFRSYVQPLLIMAIIPFGAIGAIAGHWLWGLEVTLFSLFGLVALTGVVVNDSIVLIDFINHRVRDGVPLREALVDAGRRRFRAVMLTSITTIAALFPLLLETSFQAQVLIPMATSLCYGLAFTTVLVLLLVPVLYLVYAKVTMPESFKPEVPVAAESPEVPVGRDEQVEMFAR